jgi:putative endonuclease
MGKQHETGRAWEAVGREYLARRGLRVLKQRYRCRLGELDLVCRDRSTLVIVEVRARAKSSYTTALESIGARKRGRIIAATRHLLMSHPQWSTLSVRFDVLAINGIDGESPTIEWVKNAFECY